MERRVSNCHTYVASKMSPLSTDTLSKNVKYSHLTLGTCSLYKGRHLFVVLTPVFVTAICKQSTLI